MNRLVNIVVCKLKSFGFASCTAFKSKMGVKHFHITHAHYFDVIFSRFYQKLVMELHGIARGISEIMVVGVVGRQGEFLCTINSDEHSAKRYVRSGREQPNAQEQHNEPGASCC